MRKNTIFKRGDIIKFQNPWTDFFDEVLTGVYIGYNMTTEKHIIGDLISPRNDQTFEITDDGILGKIKEDDIIDTIYKSKINIVIKIYDDEFKKKNPPYMIATSNKAMLEMKGILSNDDEESKLLPITSAQSWVNISYNEFFIQKVNSLIKKIEDTISKEPFNGGKISIKVITDNVYPKIFVEYVESKYQAQGWFVSTVIESDRLYIFLSVDIDKLKFK